MFRIPIAVVVGWIVIVCRLDAQPPTVPPLLVGVDDITWQLVLKEVADKKKPGEDLDLSSVIAALTLLELNLEAPASFASAVQTLANNGKIGGSMIGI